MRETIAKLVQYAPTFSIAENGSIIHDYFEQNKEAEGVVLVNGENPVGILMRNDFYQKIGKQFGYSLYMKRDVTLIMKSDIVCVDITCDMANFGYIAMNRSKESLYDHIVVLDNDRYAGIVSISEFLIEMSKTKEREIQLLNDQQIILRQANESEKQHRLEIEQKNASIKNLLDNAGQGFLFFGKDFLISEEQSKECDKIFGYATGNQNILAVLKEFISDDIIRNMQDAFEHVFREPDPIRNKIYLSILPGEVIINHKHIKAEYKVITQGDKSIMIILTDITEKKALELKNREEKNNVKLIIRAISCKPEILDALEYLHDLFPAGFNDLLNSGRDKKTILQLIYQIIHTMKGDFSLNSLHHTSEQLHLLEDSLTKMVLNIDSISPDDIRQFLSGINADNILAKDIEIISEALGPQYFEKDDTFQVSKQRLLDIQETIKTIFRDEDQRIILDLLDSLFYPNIKEIIRNYNDYTKAVAKKLGKYIGDFKIAGQDIYLNKNIYAEFFKSLVHIFRNIADHGIEYPDERLNSGKTEYGKITCYIEMQENRLILDIADDGSGIDSDAIRNKAVEKGFYSADEIANLSTEQILGVIFMDDFSTKSTADLLSGRGVGLAAVRTAVEKLGGSIKVETETGKYTNFEFTIPVLSYR